jgi:hypothetical protein
MWFGYEPQRSSHDDANSTDLQGVHMTSLAKSYLPLILVALFLRTAVGQSAADAQANGAPSAGTCATSALFTSTMPPAKRQLVVISGTNLAAAGTSDIESLGKDAAGIETKTVAALEIKSCTATECTVRIDHGPENVKSFVRIKCQNGQFSGWLEVHK